jgi:hypothetical protein
MGFGNNSRESYHHPIVPTGPRPAMKLIGQTSSGTPIYRCESGAEMRERLEHLRSEEDRRSPERIPTEPFYRRAKKKEQRGGDE